MQTFPITFSRNCGFAKGVFQTQKTMLQSSPNIFMQLWGQLLMRFPSLLLL